MGLYWIGQLCGGWLRAWLLKLVDPEFARTLPINDWPREMAAYCVEFEGGQGTCVHRRRFADALYRHTESPQLRVARALSSIAAYFDDCAASVRVASETIALVAAHINARVPLCAGFTDPAKLKHVSVGEHDDQKKRRRICEDYKMAISEHMLVQHRASNVHAAARSGGMCAASTAARWEVERNLCYRDASRKLGPSCWAVHVSIDGKRLGVPQQETEIYAAYTWPCDLACWLPVKVTIALKYVWRQCWGTGLVGSVNVFGWDI